MKKEKLINSNDNRFFINIPGITKAILGISLCLGLIFFPCLPAKAQFPFYSPFYYPVFNFTPYSFPVPYYPTPFISTYNTYNYLLPTTTYLLPTPSTSFVAPSIITPSAVPVPSASISGLLTDVLLLVSTDISLSPLTVSLLINTGNPQVSTLLLLISEDPTLLDYPLLLNSLINTGNSQVALLLSLLTVP